MKEFLLNEFTHPAITISRSCGRSTYEVMDVKTAIMIPIMIRETETEITLQIDDEFLEQDGLDLEPLRSTHLCMNLVAQRAIYHVKEGIEQHSAYRLEFVTGAKRWSIPPIKEANEEVEAYLSFPRLFMYNINKRNIVTFLIALVTISFLLFGNWDVGEHGWWKSADRRDRFLAFTSGLAVVCGFLSAEVIRSKLFSTYRDWKKVKNTWTTNERRNAYEAFRFLRHTS